MPEIYWYAFWVGLVLIAFGSAMTGGFLAHRARMKELEILRIYAEKGVEPPPGIAERLEGRPSPGTPAARPSSARAGHIRQFFGSVFMTSVAIGIVWWRVQDGGEPHWVVYAAGIAAIVFGAGALAQLVAAILAQEK